MHVSLWSLLWYYAASVMGRWCRIVVSDGDFPAVSSTSPAGTILQASRPRLHFWYISTHTNDGFGVFSLFVPPALVHHLMCLQKVCTEYGYNNRTTMLKDIDNATDIVIAEAHYSWQRRRMELPAN